MRLLTPCYRAIRPTRWTFRPSDAVRALSLNTFLPRFSLLPRVHEQ
jgi:hypothetical protein